MTELNNIEITSIAAGFSGLGPNLPPRAPTITCPNVEAFERWKQLHMIDAETFI